MSEAATGAAAATSEAAPKAEATETAEVTTATAEAKPQAEGANQGQTTSANETAEAKPTVPEKYELKLPEGSQLDASWVEKIATYAKERGLSNDQAQAELNERSEMLASYVQAQKNALNQQSEAWINEVKNDKEIGGAAFEANAIIAKRGVDHFCGPKVKQFLDDTGLGNHPELVRMFFKIGSMIKDDKAVMAPSAGGQTKSVADLFYGSKN